MNSIIESDFIYKNFRCIVLFTPLGHRCGYVNLNEDNPFYGIHYTRKFTDIKLSKELNDSPLGKRGIFSLFLYDGEHLSLDLVFDIHGGITYSAYSDNYPVESYSPWWIGFDCAHYDDAKDLEAFSKYYPEKSIENLLLFSSGNVKTKEYVENECKNLVNQIIYFSDILMEII